MNDPTPPQASRSSDCDLVVVGAGVAGLSAAAAARREGLRTVVIEAGARIGGRAWTEIPAFLEAPFEHGAVWLHSGERNPLTVLARQLGEDLQDAEILRQRKTFIGSRCATAADLRAYDEAWDAYEQTALRLMRDGANDPPLSAVARAMPGDDWAATVENWEGPVVAAADASALSLRDWHRNLLNGQNMLVRGGLGDFVRRRLGRLAGPVELETPATAIRWQATPGVEVETPRGTITARACIVTVSTGVLASGAIRFVPGLPPRIEDCLHGLPMGLALKVALRAKGADRLDLPGHCSFDRKLSVTGDPSMVFTAWPNGYDHVTGWVGGSRAWALTDAGDAAAEDFALRSLAEVFGGRAARAFRSGALVTRWGDDPHFLGAYAYARPGYTAARADLAAPLADGRLIFAGEACDANGLAGTVAGAWLSGERAAALAGAKRPSP